MRSSWSTASEQWGIPRDVADILALGTLGILFVEWRADESQPIHALGHWLVYLQLIWYFLPKKRGTTGFSFCSG